MGYLTTLISLFLAPYFHFVIRIGRAPKVRGQIFLNNFRDSIAVSDYPGTPKYGGTLLLREKVPPSSVPLLLSEKDQFTKSLLANTHALDWLVADVGSDTRDTVTINMGFSCLDRGSSSSIPLYFWVTPSILYPLNSTMSKVGSAEPGTAGNAAYTDIIQQCWTGRVDNKTRSPYLRMSEHPKQHEGAGEKFIKPPEITKDLSSDRNLYSRTLSERMNAADEESLILENKTNLPIVKGIPFETGVFIRVPKDLTKEPQKELRVPATLLFPLRRSLGYRLQHVNVDPAEPLTSTAILVLSILSTGLAIVVATWLVTKYISDNAIEKTRNNRRDAPSHIAVVNGDNGHNRSAVSATGQRARVVLDIIAALILFTPLALSIVIGESDPRPLVEVTTGASIYYDPANPGLSVDKTNPVAGSPFVVTAWISVRSIDEGHITAMVFSLLFVFAACVYVALHEMKRLSENMPTYPKRYPGFSLWKTYGMLKLKFQLLWNPNFRHCKVLVEFLPEIEWNLPVVEAFLLGNYDFRSLSNSGMSSRSNRKLERQIKLNAARAAAENLENSGFSGINSNSTPTQSNEIITKARPEHFILVGAVMLNSETRYKAMLTRSKFYHDVLPREWFLLTATDGMDAPTAEYYRTNGRLMEDKFLLAARMGLLPYLKFVKRIEIIDATQAPREYDEDGVAIALVKTNNVGNTSYGSYGMGMTTQQNLQLQMRRNDERCSPLLADLNPGMSMGIDDTYESVSFTVPHPNGDQRVNYLRSIDTS